MTITAKNIGRIDVWPSTTNALDADTSESKVLQRMTIWPSSAQARANVTVTDVGDGGAPEWVPEGAKGFIDCVGDQAWTEDDGEVALSAVLGSDPNTENWFDVTGFDSDDLTPDGLVYSDHAPALIGRVLTYILAGSTVVIRYRNISADATTGKSIMLMAASGNTAIEVTISPAADPEGTVELASRFGGALSISMVDTVVYSGDDALNAIAFTLTPPGGSDGHAAISPNGSAEETGAVTTDDWHTSGGDELVAFVVNIHIDAALVSIAIYDPQDDADLPALSDVGEGGATPTAYAHFADVAYFFGGSSRSLTDVFASNADWGNFNPDAVEPDIGLVVPENTTNLLGFTSSAISGYRPSEDGVTLVIAFNRTGGGISMAIDFYDTPAFGEEWTTNVIYDAASSIETYPAEVSETFAVSIAEGDHKLALTMVDGKFSASFDGQAAVTIASGLPSPSIADTLVIQAGAGGGATLTITTVDMYPPQDDADLPTLSAL